MESKPTLSIDEIYKRIIDQRSRVRYSAVLILFVSCIAIFLSSDTDLKSSEVKFLIFNLSIPIALFRFSSPLIVFSLFGYFDFNDKDYDEYRQLLRSQGCITPVNPPFVLSLDNITSSIVYIVFVIVLSYLLILLQYYNCNNLYHNHNANNIIQNDTGNYKDQENHNVSADQEFEGTLKHLLFGLNMISTIGMFMIMVRSICTTKANSISSGHRKKNYYINITNKIFRK